MEITRANFHEKLPEIKEAVDKATFIAIDCELSGLNVASEINAYDTPKQYFEKVRKNSKEFLVIQFGLCIFRYDSDNMCFKQKSYNFYIFPTRLNRMAPDHRFLCQASSIDFLISQGFDFNKLFKEGIPYLNTQSETKYREVLEEGRLARAKLYLSPQTLNTISVPEEDKPFIEQIFEEIEEFISSDKQEQILPKCNPFMRRLIYQTAQGRIDNRASLETRQVDKDRMLVVTRPKSKADRNKDEELKMKEEAEILKHSIGFSALMTYISQSQKLIIGHNMLLDVCHSIDKFLTSLPDDYESFKECVHCLFPRIIDTKYMSSTAPFKDLISSTVLSQLVSTVTTEPFSLPEIVPEDNTTSYSIDQAKEHEAGYDAYITGTAFLSMWKYLVDQKKLSNAAFKNFNLVKPYLNRLFLMRIQDAPYIQLDGPDSNPSREHVFYLTFPKDWKLNDIIQLFSPFGTIYVAWIDESSAYIALHKRDQAAVALSILSQSDTYRIMTYARRQAQLNGAQEKSSISRRKPERLPTRKRKSSNSAETIILKKKPGDGVDIASKSLRTVTTSELDESDEPFPSLVKPSRKRTSSKTFEEDNSWE